MKNMFSFCSSVADFPDISKWNINNVKEKEGMFYQCKNYVNISENLIK